MIKILKFDRDETWTYEELPGDDFNICSINFGNETRLNNKNSYSTTEYEYSRTIRFTIENDKGVHYTIESTGLIYTKTTYKFGQVGYKGNEVIEKGALSNFFLGISSENKMLIYKTFVELENDMLKRLSDIKQYFSKVSEINQKIKTIEQDFSDDTI